MYKHHEESIQKLIDYYADDERVIAIILGGSVATGCAREDSDLDAIVCVTDEYHAELARQNKLAECITGRCTYERGYFDIKYCTKSFLLAAAHHGSEPARNAFLKARCIVCHDDEVKRIVPQIGVYPVHEKAEKQKSFYAALMLNKGYFWDMSASEPYLRTRAATEIVLYGLRLLLADACVLFPCHKSLIDTVEALPHKPSGITDKAYALLKDMNDEKRDDFVNAVMSFINFKPGSDFNIYLTQYVADHEQWWYEQRPVITEW